MSPPALQHPGVSCMKLVVPTEKRTWKQLCLPQYLFAWDLWLFQSCCPASQKLFTLAQKQQLNQKNTAKSANLCCSNRFPKFMLVTDSRPSLLPWKMAVFPMVSDWRAWWAYPGQPVRQSCWLESPSCFKEELTETGATPYNNKFGDMFNTYTYSVSQLAAGSNPCKESSETEEVRTTWLLPLVGGKSPISAAMEGH